MLLKTFDTTVDNQETGNLDTHIRIRFHIDPAMLKRLQDSPGFVPVIINIKPLKSLSKFLGLSQNIG